MKGYQAHEVFHTDIKMYLGMLRWGMVIGIIAQILFLGGFSYRIYHGLLHTRVYGTQGFIPKTAIIKYFSPIILSLEIRNPKIAVEPEIKKIFWGVSDVSQSVYRDRLNLFTGYAFAKARINFIRIFWLSFFMYIWGLLYILIFIEYSKKMSDEDFVRGIDLMPLARLNDLLNIEIEKEIGVHLTIGKTPLPFDMETKHLLILGTSGSGKSVLINQIIRQINRRKKPVADKEPVHKDKIVIYDTKGEFISKQWEPGDLIFSPFDERTICWSLFNEIENYPDLDVLAKSLYVCSETKDEYWYNCAKDVFRTGLVYLVKNGMTTNRDLLNYFSQTMEEIKHSFMSLPLTERGALKHIDRADSNTSASIISILQERIQFLRYIADMDGAFSFRKYMRTEEIKHNLFIMNIDNYKTIFKPLMTLVVDIMIRETLSLNDDLQRRIFYVVDELGSLYRLDSLLDLLTMGRSKGACVLCSNQDLGRIEEIYGHQNTVTFFNNFNTNVFFRINEPKTADFLSLAIGEKQIVIKMESNQMSPKETGDRAGFSNQDRKERVILPTEFQNMKDFQSVIKISNFGISKIVIPKIFYPKMRKHFTMKRFDILEEIQKQEMGGMDLNVLLESESILNLQHEGEAESDLMRLLEDKNVVAN